jgi:hypothetical protein
LEEVAFLRLSVIPCEPGPPDPDSVSSTRPRKAEPGVYRKREEDRFDNSIDKMMLPGACKIEETPN